MFLNRIELLNKDYTFFSKYTFPKVLFQKKSKKKKAHVEQKLSWTEYVRKASNQLKIFISIVFVVKIIQFYINSMKISNPQQLC